MTKLLSFLMVIVLTLSTCACAAEARNGGSNETADSGHDISESIPTAEPGTAVWPKSFWSTSTPELQGVNPALLADADSKIKDNFPNVYSLLVVRHEYLVYGKYYNGMSENDANPVYSVTKSVMSALTGIAKRDGLISSTDQKLSDLFPNYFTQSDDLRKNDITIKNVLTMTGGLESIDSDYYSYFMCPDFLSYVLQKPLTDKPGDKFVYNTGLTHFLSAIISEQAGISTKEFADEYLFSKIGISVDNWQSDNAGVNIGGFGINMKPADMAKFGYLYLHNGSWDGNQVIPEEWIKESTQKQISAGDDMDYGYLFWLQTIRDNVNGREFFTYRAAGSGGQYIMVVPDLDMVVVITADDNLTSNDGANTLDIITDYVIPAAQ